MGGASAVVVAELSLLGDGESNPRLELARRYLELLLATSRREAVALILDAVEGGVSIRDVYLHVFQPVQRQIGHLWQLNRISVATEHFCTAVTQLVMSQLYPRLFAGARRELAMVATCVGDELHEIGVRMVADFFEMDGWDTYYLGANTPPGAVVEEVVAVGARLLAVSATMSFHLHRVSRLVELVRAGSGDDVKILVGGLPFNHTPGLWRRVGADGTAEDAEKAVAVASELVG
jgi:methanogenic corrinoid protein MtbC1